TVRSRKGATDKELRVARRDVLTGMALSGLVMYFIILTTGATLHVSGQRDIESARQAAEALRPVAGDAAYLLFALGLIGTGLLGVPVLAGSAAYAVAEAMHWRGSLDDKPNLAPRFYGVLAAAVALGLVLCYLNINPVRMLFYAAVVNGVLAPPLVLLVTLLTSDTKIMGARTNPPILRWLGLFTAAVMAGARAALFFVLCCCPAQKRHPPLFVGSSYYKFKNRNGKEVSGQGDRAVDRGRAGSRQSLHKSSPSRQKR